MARVDYPRRLATRMPVDPRILGSCAVGVFMFAAPLLLGRSAGPIVSHRNIAAIQPTRLPSSAERWVQPQSGWLYVLDYNGMSETSQILLVNPAKGATVGVIPSGYAPDMALSPDGKRLYIASGAPGSISVVDTATGIIFQQVPATDRGVQLGESFSNMIVSQDSRWLLSMEMKGGPPVPISYDVAVYDTSHDLALVGRTAMDACGVGQFKWTGENKLLVHCYDSNSINVLTLEGQGQITVGGPPLILPRSTGRAINVSVLPDSGTAAVFADSGAVSGLNVLSQASFSKTARPRTSGRQLEAKDWPRSEDGRKIYLGTSSKTSGKGADADQIEVFDTTVWQYTETIKTSVPFFSLSLSKDGRYLYGISPSERKVLIVNTLLSAEVGVIELPARQPTLAIVAP